MGMRIWWQHIFPPQDQMEREIGLRTPVLIEDASTRVLENLRRVARPDTEIDFHYVRHSAYLVQTPYHEMLNNVWLVEGVIEAERQGYDAVIIGCANDPALCAARQAVDIPVVAPTESAMLLACTLGGRFGMITALDENLAFCDRNIRGYGMDLRTARPVRVFRMGENWVSFLFEMMMNPAIIQPQFDRLCRACVADGAEVILPVCCALSPAVSMLGYREVPSTGVPVLDVTHAALKTAETLVDLWRGAGVGKSQRCTFKSVPREMRDAMGALARPGTK
ncbi:MAG: aspartate/glutamate racemase family protein [bacterium]